MLIEAIQKAPDAERLEFISRVAIAAGNLSLAKEITHWDPDELASALISGLNWARVGHQVPSLARLRATHHSPNDMALQPIANLMFMRDPCISIYDTIVPSHDLLSSPPRTPCRVLRAHVGSGCRCRQVSR